MNPWVVMRTLGDKCGYRIIPRVNPYMGYVQGWASSGRWICIWNMDRRIPRIENENSQRKNIEAVGCKEHYSMQLKSSDKPNAS